MWEIRKTDHFVSRENHYAKKHPRELDAVLKNLVKFVNALNADVNPRQIRLGFIHPERSGVVAIDQKGRGKDLAQTRLYVCPQNGVLHLLTLGDKQSQKQDIKYCVKTVSELRKQKGKTDEDE